MKALFAGSFDPPSWGHYEIIRRALSLCGELVIAIAANPNKQSLFTMKKREKMIRGMTKDLSGKIKIIFFDGLLIDLAKKEKVSFLLRGLRTVADFEHEMQMAIANRRMSGIETIFLMSDEKHAHISSTLIREIAQFGGPLKEFVPPSVEREMKTPKRSSPG